MIDAKIKKISDLCGGKPDMDFKQALAQVIENLGDAKCDAKAARRIVMTMGFYPDPASKIVAIEVDTVCKLAKQGARRSLVYYGAGQDGQLGLFNEDPDQTQMFNDMEKATKEREANQQ
jgi:hypothetical protein